MMEIKKINAFQEQYYEDIDKMASDWLLKRFEPTLRKFNGNGTIKVLDVGGGSGFFSMKIREYFSENNCEIYVLDTTKYKTWNEFSEKVTFIEDSAENIEKTFEDNKFDIVFAKYVFHHFVKNTWKDSIKSMEYIIGQINKVLKNNGRLCIVDQFYNGYPLDSNASKMIYMFTTCKFPLFPKIFKRLGAQSAGVGVCFLSKKMWLKLLSNNGFGIETLEEPVPTKRKWYEHIGLLLKTWNDGCMIIANKQ